MNPQRQVRRTGVRPTYARRPVTPPTKRMQVPEIKISWIRWAAVGTVILLVLTGLARLTTLNTVKVEGTRGLSASQVQKLAEDGLERQWFGRSLLLVNTGALENFIEQSEPAVREATIVRKPFHSILIKINERQPTLNWRTGNQVYLLDADATVIGPTQGSYAKLPTVTDSTHLPVKEGDRVAPSSFVAFCSDLAAKLAAGGYGVGEMTVPATTSEVYVRSTGNLLLKFDTTRPAGEQIADLQAVQTELKRARKTPTEYIDLRIPHKAYYK